MKKGFFKRLIKIFTVVLITVFSFIIVGCDGVDFGGDSSSFSEYTQEGSGEDIINPSSDNPDDYYKRVLILTDAESTGVFYDNITNTNMSFSELLDRQIITFTNNILYALNVVYGDNSVYPSNGSLDLSSTWNVVGSSNNVIINASTVLSDINYSNSHLLGCVGSDSVINFSCPACITKLAGVNGTISSNPFDFNNSITNTNNIWKITNLESNKEAIKEGIANIICSGDYNRGDSYENVCLKKIDHLGFTVSELNLIKDYVKKEVIGTNALIYDNNLKNILVSNTADINSESFTSNTDLLNYRSYNDMVNVIVDRANNLFTNGNYSTELAEGENTYRAVYPKLARVNVSVFLLSEIFSKTENTADYDLDNFTEDDLNNMLNEGEDDNATPLFDTPKKILSIVFLPTVSDDLQNDFETELRTKAEEGELEQSFVNSFTDWDKFYLGSFNMGVKGSTVDGYENDLSSFKLKYSFNITINGEDIISKQNNNNYISNDCFSDTDDELKQYFPNETEIAINGETYSSKNGIGSFYLSGAIEKESEDGKDKLMGEYNGPEIVSAENNLNSEYFTKVGDEYFLNVWNDLFSVIEKNTTEITDEFNTTNITNYTSGINSEFLGGDNFWQISYEYYNNSNESISAQYLQLMYLSIFTF